MFQRKCCLLSLKVLEVARTYYCIAFIAVSYLVLREELTSVYLCSVAQCLPEIKKISVILYLSIRTSNALLRKTIFLSFFLFPFLSFFCSVTT
jgi:hypothetical protein